MTRIIRQLLHYEEPFEVKYKRKQIKILYANKSYNQVHNETNSS